MLTDFTGSVPFQRYMSAIRQPHPRRVRVGLYTPELQFVEDLTPLFVSGSRVIDTTADTVMTAEVTLHDPGRLLRALNVRRSRVVRLFDDRFILDPTSTTGAGDWVACPVFTGPLTSDPRREGSTVTLSLADMAWYALGDLGRGDEWHKEDKVTDVIKALLRRSGETRLGAIPDRPNRLGEKLELARTEKKWPHAQSLAKDIGYNLFYNTRGVPLMRKPAPKPCLTIGDESVAGDLQTDGGERGQFNKIEVLGKKKHGGRIVGHAALPSSNPLSASANGRESSPRVSLKQIDAPHCDNQKDANQRADKEAAAIASLEEANSINCIPYPNLEPWDLVVTKGQAGNGRIRLRQETLPLTGGTGTGEPQTLGGTRNVKPPRKGGSRGASRPGTSFRRGGAGRVAD